MKERWNIPRKVERIEVPEIGEVLVRELTQWEYEQWVTEWYKRDGGPPEVDYRRYAISLIRRSVVDEQGNLVFSQEDDDFLAGLPARVTRPIVQCAERLNGLGPEALREAKKNSDGDQEA